MDYARSLFSALAITASPLEVIVLLASLGIAFRALPLARLAWRERAWAQNPDNRANDGEVAIAMWRFDNNLVKLVTVWCIVLIALYSVLLPASTSRPPEGGDWIPNLRRAGTVGIPLLMLAPSVVVAWSNERAYKWRRQQNHYLRRLKAAAGDSRPVPVLEAGA